MNKIVEKIGKDGLSSYQIMIGDEKIIGELWTEKKEKDGKPIENVHIRWKEDGKYRYMMKSKFDEKKIKNECEIPEKTEKASGGWRSKLTEDEKKRIEELENEIETIKQTASKREKEVDIDKLIDKLTPEQMMKLLAQLQNK